MNRLLLIVAFLLPVSTLLLCYAARHTFFAETMLVGDWRHAYHASFYPKYSSILSIRSDKTFKKIEEYTEWNGGKTVVSTFEGTYTINENGIEAGKVAFHFYDATARTGETIVANSPRGGFTSICHYAFDVRGNLLIRELVNGINGNRKNPEELPDNKLVPSFEHYQRIRQNGG